MNYIAKINLDGSTAPIGASLFGRCNTAADEGVKVVDIPEFDELSLGVTITVLFLNGNTHSSSTELQVGESRATRIWYKGELGGFPYFEGNTTLSFTFSMVANQPCWILNDCEIYPTVICDNRTSAKKGYWYFNMSPSNSQYLIVTMTGDNAIANALTFSINSGSSYPIYINGEISSSTNYTLPSGTYIVYYTGSAYYFNTDGSIPNLKNQFVQKEGDTMTGNLTVTSISEPSIITSGSPSYTGAGLLRARNYNGWAQLYAGSTEAAEVGLSIATALDGAAQSVVYRKNTSAKSPTYFAGYQADNNVHDYVLGVGAISGKNFKSIPTIESNGVMEIGKYIDFHNTDTDTTNYTFRFNNTSNGKLSASGTCTWNSSRKVKENIEDITLEEAKKVLELNPVSFDYIDGSKDERGFIAEDVAEVLPNLVTPEEDDIPASLNYIGIIPYLVKVIQDQEKRLDEQAKEIELLKNK